MVRSFASNVCRVALCWTMLPSDVFLLFDLSNSVSYKLLPFLLITSSLVQISSKLFERFPMNWQPCDQQSVPIDVQKSLPLKSLILLLAGHLLYHQRVSPVGKLLSNIHLCQRCQIHAVQSCVFSDWRWTNPLVYYIYSFWQRG